MSRSARTKLWLLLLMRQQPSTASEVNASEAAQLMGQPSNTSEVNEYYEPEVAQSTSPEVRMLTLGAVDAAQATPTLVRTRTPLTTPRVIVRTWLGTSIFLLE